MTNQGYLAMCKHIRREVFVKGQGVSEAIDFDGKDPDCGHLLLLIGDEAVGDDQSGLSSNVQAHTT